MISWKNVKIILKPQNTICRNIHFKAEKNTKKRGKKEEKTAKTC